MIMNYIDNECNAIDVTESKGKGFAIGVDTDSDSLSTRQEKPYTQVI